MKASICVICVEWALSDCFCFLQVVSTVPRDDAAAKKK
jgi:hypothetical protein